MGTHIGGTFISKYRAPYKVQKICTCSKLP